MSDPSAPAELTWGTDVRRRADGIPFLQYEPRRRRLPDLLVDAARWADRTHLVQGRRRISFGQFFAAVDATAADLGRRGIGPGSCVLLLAANCPEWVVSFWAVARTGAVVAPGNGWWSEEEVDHALALLAPALVIGDPKRLAKVTSAQPPASMDLAEVRALVDAVLADDGSVPRTGDPAGLAPAPAHAGPAPAAAAGSGSAPGPPVPGGDEDEAAVVVFTSGTTGYPKGATLAHRSVIANAHDLLAVSGRLPHQVDPDRAAAVNLVTGPLFHIGGIQTLCLALVGGNKLVFLEGRFDAREVLELIEAERVTVWGGVPTMARRVLEDPDVGSRDLMSVRSISLGGAPVPPDLVGRLRDTFPNAGRGVSTVYGMTELGGTVAAASGKVMAEHPGTSGRPQTLVDLKIGAPDGDGVGEILVRTPAQMLGYWGDSGSGTGPPAPEAIDAEGFVRTGDLGRVEGGLLWITGRSKDLIIRGGENVAAPRVEAVILQHGDVVDAAVVGLPHDDWGEEVAAAVILRAGVADAAAVAEFCTTKLAHFEVPTRWWVRTEPLPTNDTGKVDKRTLRSMWPAVL